VAVIWDRVDAPVALTPVCNIVVREPVSVSRVGDCRRQRRRGQIDLRDVAFRAPPDAPRVAPSMEELAVVRRPAPLPPILSLPAETRPALVDDVERS
jgi:hypothetical protein